MADSERQDAREVIAADPDIGMCDDCGTDEGRRFRTIISGTWDGKPGRCVAWLCGDCKRARSAGGS